MDKRKQLKRAIWLMTLTTMSVMICYYFVDKQVAIWVSQQHLRSYRIFKHLSQIPEAFIGLVPICYLFLVARFSFDRWTTLDQRCLVFANTIAITQFLKDFFKFVFGRYWPETWYNNNPSLIKDNQYGFHFFHKGVKYGSFPSGHTATLLAVITLFWWFFPRHRIVTLMIALAGIIGIIGMDYHFVGDVISGGTIGYLVATYTASFICPDLLSSAPIKIKAKDSAISYRSS